MRILLYTILILINTTILQAQFLFIKGDLPDDIKTSTKEPCPIDRCHILIIEDGAEVQKLARTYANQLNPRVIAKLKIKTHCEYVFIEINSPGYKRWTRNFEVQDENGKLYIDLGKVQLTKINIPKIENVIQQINRETGYLNYEINFSNNTERKYTVGSMVMTLLVKHDFNTAGISNIAKKYLISDELFMRDSTIVVNATELIDRPEYLLPCNGHISFYKNQGFVKIEIEVLTFFELITNESYHIQFELPKTIQIINETELFQDPMFTGTSLNLLYFNIDNITQTTFEFKTTNNDYPSINYKKTN